jgi:hypothetical protein
MHFCSSLDQGPGKPGARMLIAAEQEILGSCVLLITNISAQDLLVINDIDDFPLVEILSNES